MFSYYSIPSVWLYVRKFDQHLLNARRFIRTNNVVRWKAASPIICHVIIKSYSNMAFSLVCLRD